jgi:chromosome segregation ATPase
LQGYSLTPKGEKRLLALRDFLHQDLIVKMSPDWNVADDREQEFDGETFEKTEGAGEPQAASASEPEVKPKSEFTTDQIVRLESWLSELKEHNERISEIEGLMEDLRSEKEDEMHHLAGVEVAREKALRQREELDRELSRLDSKKSDLEGKVAKKDVEIDEWNAELRAHISNKSRIEGDIGSSTGMQRTS